MHSKRRAWGVSSIIILLSFSLLACSGDDKPGAPSLPGPAGPRPAGNAPPEVVSASVYPAKPTAAKTLIAHYEGRDRDSDYIYYTFRWFVNGEQVQEGTLGSLDPGHHKKGSAVYVEVIPSDKYSSGDALRSDPVTVLNLPPVIESVALKPSDPPVGTVITAEPKGADPDGDEVRYQYQWHVNGKAVTDRQESNSFSTKGLKKKDAIHALVVPSDFDSSGEPTVSDSAVLLNRAPVISSSPPYSLTKGVYVYRVTAADPDGDGLTFKLLASPSGMTIDPSSGVIQWKTPQSVSTRQDVPIKISVDDGDGGSVTQAFSLVLEPQ